MADSGFQEVFLDGPLHKVVVDCGFGDTLVVGSGFDIVALKGTNVG